MNRDLAERILSPVWIGLAASQERIAAALEAVAAQPLTVQRLQEEAELQEAAAYLKARARGFIGDGLMTAVDTGRAVYCWPNAYPGSDAASRVVAEWEARRAAKATPPPATHEAATANVQPLQRPA